MQQTIWHLGQGALLGLVQGITEFLPISSTGHLIIAQSFLKLPDPGNVFDATLHLGTLLAIVIYFYRDWWQMLFPASKGAAKSTLVPNRRLLGLILVATIPAVLIGYLIRHWVENYFRSLLSVAVLMIAVGITYLVFERFVKSPKVSKPLTVWDATSIGIAQSLAMVSAISRSGMTLLAGMYVGLTREAAARFSFLLAAPVMVVAGGYSLYQAWVSQSIAQDYWFWIIAFVVSFLAGLFAINWLLKFYQKYSLSSFAYYLLAVGAGLIVYNFWH